MATKRKRRFIAYEIDAQAGMPLEPAPTDREWMDNSGQRYAYRCLPLVIANQAGWIIRCPVDLRLSARASTETLVNAEITLSASAAFSL